VTATMSTAREVAHDAFVLVMEHGRDPDEATEELILKYDKQLKRIDRNLIKEILFGSLRWYSKIYWILQKTSSRDLDKTTPEVRSALILGTYQIFYMDRVPDRAAVNESVEYIRKKGQGQAVGFINGILRQIARRAEYFAKPDKQTQSAQYLALQFAHPEWIVRRWLMHFKFDRMEKMLASNNQPPPWSVRVNSLKIAMEDTHILQDRLLKEEKTHTNRYALRGALTFQEAPKLDPESIFGQGYYTIQDHASQLIGFLVAPEPGQPILDAACGPGGKLTHIYELSDGKALVTGVEKNPRQMERTKQTVNRLGHTAIELIEADFLDYKPKEAPAKILVDAPCSGLGVLRRHPEGKWQKKLSLVGDMMELQRRFLTHALEILAPGGELIYSVCSFEPEETTQQLAWLREKYGDTIELLSPVGRLPDYFKRYVTRDNVLMIFAGNQDDLDGFGAFIVKKK
jgi:16S rRNA (cytosine967-C5)-methyltransferase